MPRSVLAALLGLPLLASACVDDTENLPDGGPPDTGPAPLIDAGSIPDAGFVQVVDAGCQPSSCILQGATCGEIDDGCGNIIDCGSCEATWTRMSDDGAPELRRLAASVFDGRGLVIYGGTNGRGPATPVGARYDVATDRWRALSTVNAPPPTLQACAATYRGQTLVFGGTHLDGGQALLSSNQGGMYDPEQDTWRPFPLAGAPTPRTHPGCAVVGDQFIVAGGAVTEDSVGAALDLNTWTWSALPAPPAPLSFPSTASDRAAVYFSGSPWQAYSPRSGWRSLPEEGSPSHITSVGIGETEGGFYVFGGARYGEQAVDTLTYYDALRDRWTPIELEGGPSPRVPLVTAWTGRELLTFGCNRGDCRDGFHYQPETNRWRPMPRNAAIGAPPSGFGAWTGEVLLIVPGGPVPGGGPSRGWIYRP